MFSGIPSADEQKINFDRIDAQQKSIFSNLSNVIIKRDQPIQPPSDKVETLNNNSSDLGEATTANKDSIDFLPDQ